MLENAHWRPFWRCFWSENGEMFKWRLCILPLQGSNNPELLTSYKSNRVIGSAVQSLDASKIWGQQKLRRVGRYRRRNHPCQILRQSASGFGVLTFPNLHCSIGLAGRCYNSVSTAVLHCDVQRKLRLQRKHHIGRWFNEVSRGETIYNDFSIFFKMSAIRHLGLVWHFLGPPS